MFRVLGIRVRGVGFAGSGPGFRVRGYGSTLTLGLTFRPRAAFLESRDRCLEPRRLVPRRLRTKTRIFRPTPREPVHFQGHDRGLELCCLAPRRLRKCVFGDRPCETVRLGGHLPP